MTAKALSSAIPTYTLTVREPSGDTSKFKLVSPVVHIGRSSDNDISVNDPKISRQQAKLVLGPFGYEIYDLSDKNTVYVNGEAIKSAPLSNNSKINIGNSEFIFEASNSQQLARQQPSPASGPAHLAASPPEDFTFRPQPRRKKKSPTFKLLIVGLAAFFGWILFSGPAKKQDQVGITSERDIEADIEAAKQLKQAAEKQQQVENKNTLQFKQAQSAYIRGFRDYKKGHYDRSSEAFQTCLSLYPTHALCTRYLNLSRRKFNELIQYHMILGTEYKDRNQFSSCMNSFRTVVVMLKNKNSKIYQQAKANYEACEAQLGQRF